MLRVPSIPCFSGARERHPSTDQGKDWERHSPGKSWEEYNYCIFSNTLQTTWAPSFGGVPGISNNAVLGLRFKNCACWGLEVLLCLCLMRLLALLQHWGGWKEIHLVNFSYPLLPI